jgi:hypothetical protein
MPPLHLDENIVKPTCKKGHATKKMAGMPIHGKHGGACRAKLRAY